LHDPGTSIPSGVLRCSVRPTSDGFDQPTTISLEELVSQDNSHRHLDATLDLSFVRAWAADSYAEGGRPSTDSVVFLKLQLVMFFEGIRSERQRMRVVADRLSVRWYTGVCHHARRPHRAALSRLTWVTSTPFP
jgi:transposase